jgi:hypothetical protein
MLKNALVAGILIAGVFAFAFTACDSRDSKDNPGHTHQWGEWEVTIPATCAENGIGTRYCETCGEEDPSHIIPALGGDDCTEEKMSFYFAYGRNLNPDVMKTRCPESIEIGGFMLNGYRLLFRKHGYSSTAYLTIEEDEGSSVPIGIYRISAEDERRLDGYEGVPTRYTKEWLDYKISGETITGLAYIMVNPTKAAPSTEYYESVKGGYEHFGFDISYLDGARAECEE